MHKFLAFVNTNAIKVSSGHVTKDGLGQASCKRIYGHVGVGVHASQCDASHTAPLCAIASRK